MSERDRRILAAIASIMAEGLAPSVRTVRAVLLEQYGEAMSHRDLGPALRRWRERRRRKAQDAAALARAYGRLDPEQQRIFRRATGLGPKGTA